MKPSKVQATANAITTFLFALGSTWYLVTGDYVFATIGWLATAMWAYATVRSVREYRTIVNQDREIEAKLKALQQHVASGRDRLN